MDYKILAEQYIQKQERHYNRPLKDLNKFLLRDFSEYLEKVDKSPNIRLDISNGKTPRKIGGNVPALVGKKIRVALITEDVGHLTGGRYYCWFIACALMELGYEVIVYTNRSPVFGSYFEKYKKPEIKVVAEKAKLLETIDVEADIYLGSPISGNVAAANLGKKYNKPAYALIFDPFPMMDIYLGKRTYTAWFGLIKALRSTPTKIISLCESTSKFIPEWLNKRPEQITAIYPCINSREFDDTPLEKEDYVVFISRLVKHKNFEHVLRACKNLGIRLKVISSVDGIGADKLVKDMGMRKMVDFCMRVSDKEKFEIIKKSRVVVNASKFEGFGMWFIEAITCGVPTVCYEYPTIKEIKNNFGVDNVYMAEWNSPKALELELAKAWSEKKFREYSKAFYFDTMVSRVREVFEQEPKIGVITIALNEEKFIEASLRSVVKHPNIKKVAVVEGAVNLFSHAADENGFSLDGTYKKVMKVMDFPGGDKIVYDRYGWAVDKSELRNRALELLGNDITHVLVVDADEVYKYEDLDNLVGAMKDNPHTGVFLFPFYHFWKQKDLVAVGGQWNAQMFRCFKYANKKLRWKSHELPVVDEEGRFINVSDGQVVLDNVHVYHYGYMKDKEDVVAKLEYYKKRDGHVLDVKDTWSDWKEGEPTQPTHGGGTAVKFEGSHPEIFNEL